MLRGYLEARRSQPVDLGIRLAAGHLVAGDDRGKSLSDAQCLQYPVDDCSGAGTGQPDAPIAGGHPFHRCTGVRHAHQLGLHQCLHGRVEAGADLRGREPQRLGKLGHELGRSPPSVIENSSPSSGRPTDCDSS